MTYKVIQWATGGVGKEALRCIIRHPRLELVGSLVYSAEKEGQDAGQICGLDPVGVTATRDKDAILKLNADCVCYTPLTPDLTEVCALLESGKNVVTSAFLFYPPYMPAGDLRRIEAACERGRTSVHGTGINPGFVGDLLVLVLSSLCRRIEHVHVTERGDWSLIDSPKMIFDLARFGHDPKEVVMENHPYARFMSGLFLESVGLVAAGIGTRLDDKRTIQELEVSDKDFQVAGRPVRAGTVSGQRYRWQGLLNDKAVIEIETLWTIGDQYPAHWPKARAGWTVTIEGEPSLQVTFISLATLDWAKKVPFSEHINSTLVATAAHAVNSVIPVCEAEPGVRTFPDLPLITGAHAGP